MADKLNFTTPQQVAAPASSFEMVAIHKRRKPDWFVHIELMDDTHRTKDINIGGDLAKDIVKKLNKSDNSAKSEERRILEWLQANGPAGPTDPNKYLGAGAYEAIPDEPAPPPPPPAAPPAP